MSGSTSPILGYYTKLVFADQSGAMTVWHVSASEFVILALIGFLVLQERDKRWHDCRNPPRVHGGCGMTSLVSIAIRRHVDQYGSAQLVAGCDFDTGGAYLIYRLSADIEWSCLRRSDFWFPYTFGIGQHH